MRTLTAIDPTAWAHGGHPPESVKAWPLAPASSPKFCRSAASWIPRHETRQSPCSKLGFLVGRTSSRHQGDVSRPAARWNGAMPLAEVDSQMERFQETLRRLAMIDETFIQDQAGLRLELAEASALDSRTAALVQVGVSAAIGSPAVSLEWSAARALAAGASEDQIADVLLAIAPVAGLDRVVAAAPHIGIAPGYDVAAAVIDIFVYVVVLNSFVEYLPGVLSETFTLSGHGGPAEGRSGDCRGGKEPRQGAVPASLHAGRQGGGRRYALGGTGREQVPRPGSCSLRLQRPCQSRRLRVSDAADPCSTAVTGGCPPPASRIPIARREPELRAR